MLNLRVDFADEMWLDRRTDEMRGDDFLHKKSRPFVP